jgi:hypothetical protein
MNPARRLTWMIIVMAVAAAVAAAWPLVFTGGPGPSEYLSVRGETVILHGYGPYRHMPAEVAIQGLAQDLVTLLIAVPALLVTLVLARRGSGVGYVALTGTVGYLFVQYALYLAMATYNELFLLWVLIVLATSQVLVRLLLSGQPQVEGVLVPTPVRRCVGAFLLLNGTLIALLWLSVIVPPLLDGTLYPPGLAHLTTTVVQGFDLALFIPPSLLAGYWYLRGQAIGNLLAPVYAAFLSLQMTALLAKIVWMQAIGVSAGPALVVIPMLLIGAALAAFLSLRPLSTSGPFRRERARSRALGAAWGRRPMPLP